jgi:putrescine---pyruvate transaminase
MAVSDHPTTATTRFWHPFADMGAVSQKELLIERGDGVWVYDSDGKRYFDATASLWYANIGHGREEVAEAVARQMRTLEAYSTFGDFGNRPANELTERLAATSPMPDTRIFLTSGGGDSIDTAAKIARRHWVVQGQPERMHLISRTNGYHGTHGFGTSIAGIPANLVGYGELIPHVSVVDRDSVEALEAEIDRVGAERIAAFIFEPVIGAGGVYPAPDGYIEAVAEVCTRAGILLIADSTICGFGRLGTWFGTERWDITPDMIVFAKGVTSGYLPLGGVVISGRVAEPFWTPGATGFRHGQTYAGHATCCAAGLATLDLLEREALLRRGADLENDLLLMLAAFKDDPLVSHVRGGVGLLAALELDPELLSVNPSAPAELARHIREVGVLVRPLSTAIAVSPPLTITVDHLATIADGIKQGLDALRN